STRWSATSAASIGCSRREGPSARATGGGAHAVRSRLRGARARRRDGGAAGAAVYVARATGGDRSARARARSPAAPAHAAYALRRVQSVDDAVFGAREK